VSLAVQHPGRMRPYVAGTARKQNSHVCFIASLV
jgi:hypothetical protein